MSLPLLTRARPGYGVVRPMRRERSYACHRKREADLATGPHERCGRNSHEVATSKGTARGDGALWGRRRSSSRGSHEPATTKTGTLARRGIAAGWTPEPWRGRLWGGHREDAHAVALVDGT